MIDDTSIEKNHATFRQMVADVEAAIACADWNQAIYLSGVAARWAWLNSCGIFASPELEALLTRIGSALPDHDACRRGEGKRHVVTVMSSAHDSGGHTRLATRWMALDKASRHTLVLILQDGIELPSLVTDLVAEGTVELVVLDDDSYVDRVLHLRKLLAQSDYAVLHIRPNDAIAVAALAGMAEPPPVLLEDHANHCFWIGASVANVVVSLHESGIRVATDRRGVPRAHINWVPMPLDYAKLDRAGSNDVRARRGIPHDAVLLMSSGAPYKFIPIDDISLSDLLEPILTARPDVHLLVVGPDADPANTHLAQRYPQRVHMVGFLNEAALTDCYNACDIYLESAPFPSGTALAEAAAVGRPILKFSPAQWRRCSFAVDIDAVPAPAYIWSDKEGYRQDLLYLIDHPEQRVVRGHFARASVRACHGDAMFLSTLEAAYACATHLPRITLDAAACAQRTELLDTLLLKMAKNAEEPKNEALALFSTMRASTPQERYTNWLAMQRLHASQIKLLQPTLREHDRVHVVVLDLDDDTAALAETSRSLGEQSLAACDIHVLKRGDCAPVHEGTEPDWITPFNVLASASRAEVLLTLRAGDTLSADALLLLAMRFMEQPSIACCYMDEDAHVEDGLFHPVFKPDLNLDLLRSYPYIGRALAVRGTALLLLGGLATAHPALSHYDFVLRVIEQCGLEAVGHLAEVTVHARLSYAAWLGSPAVTAHAATVVSAHLQRLGIAHAMQPGVLPGFNRVRYLHHRTPPVSIIIPTRDQLPLLNGLIDSLLNKTGYANYELLIVDNDSRDPAARAFLDGIERLNSPQLRVLRYPHPFNYSAINNFAAAQARGEYLILLNNDAAVLHSDWIDALLNHAQRPEVGIVGAKLHFPDGRIQHGGVVLGLRGAADHPFIGQPMEAHGYMQRLQVDQNYSAVSAACLMIRKSIYDQVGGLDEHDFKLAYNDIDLCLKVRQAGYLTVWTPYARLMHVGGASRSHGDALEQPGPQEAMYRKWLPLLANDPAYNHNLDLDDQGFDLDRRRIVAWQPFAKPISPRMYCVAADAHHRGHYRVRQPFLSMQRASIAEGAIADKPLTPITMERFGADTIVLQRQLSDAQLDSMRSYTAFSRAFKVYELDEYVAQAPLDGLDDATPEDMRRALHKAVALTDRLVVSTDRLAEQFGDLHTDIRVVPTRLPVHWWEGVRSERRVGKKPRVGWSGDAGDRRNLEVIADVVRDLADEVEWVFLGACPDALRPYIHEFHEGVSAASHPKKLASLNLDLALAPLDETLFNECKGSTPLLEYGACAIPVVCTDIVSYQGPLPVTRVTNRDSNWLEAIRMHLDDPAASGNAGDALRDAVVKDWLLTDDKALAWRDAWLPD
ncbi:glycosyltransferase [Dyella monticola]|uniref:Glycosyltransferase n=1 Tax=Dyella monticola TaxID=1927958 RepID=A0A370WU53_9GAMM|nr:glycosyltransferase [Dyella monticola]RDS79673.1 glycosyltransferase [Dyella monticola]